MDILSAFSGLERIAIIAGAMLVGYWGYRLLATDRTPALVFMGIACAVLVGALFTGNSHVKNIGESYQLANAGAAQQTEVPDLEPAEQLSPTQPPNDSPDPIAAVDEPLTEPLTEEVTETSNEAVDLARAPSEPPIEDVASTPAPETSDLLSSQELGGRIVSVKSESVTLEWSPRDG